MQRSTRLKRLLSMFSFTAMSQKSLAPLSSALIVVGPRWLMRRVATKLQWCVGSNAMRFGLQCVDGQQRLCFGSSLRFPGIILAHGGGEKVGAGVATIHSIHPRITVCNMTNLTSPPPVEYSIQPLPLLRHWSLGYRLSSEGEVVTRELIPSWLWLG